MENLSTRSTSMKAKIKPTLEAERLRVFRKANNLSQIEFGEIINVTQPQVNKYETNRNMIPIEVAKLLHTKLQMNYEWFYHGKGSMKLVPKKTTLADTLEVSSELARVKEEVYSLKETVKKLVRDVYDKSN